MASNNKVTMVGMSWCGFSIKQADAIKKNNADIDVVMCDITPEHESCSVEGVKGYPTFINQEKNICQVGYSEDPQPIFDKCTSSSS